jgi:DNA repair protein RadC
LEPSATVAKPKAAKPLKPRQGTELFGKAALREAIQLLPSLPDSESLDDIRDHLRKNLHFSAEETRKRYAAYIARRLFPDGIADQALRAFGRANASTPELKEVCFYRFCKAEPLMQRVMVDLFLPALGLGRVRRERIMDYLQSKFPESKSASDCTQAIVDALVAGGIAAADRKQVTFAMRPIRPASFAFALHSEFPEPGIYEVAKAESNRLLSCLLWTPERILAALYELRNTGMISKISEIDSVRQFTLKFDLLGAVNQMVKGVKAA